VTGTTYPVLTLTELSQKILLDDEPVFIMVPKEKPKAKADTRRLYDEHESEDLPDQDLFARLKALRSSIAREEHVPAYMVSTDANIDGSVPKKTTQPDPAARCFRCRNSKSPALWSALPARDQQGVRVRIFGTCRSLPTNDAAQNSSAG